MEGFLLIDKPLGMTSHDVVATVRRRLQETLNKGLGPQNTRGSKVQSPKFKVPKVGHAGTLDPLATGLLIIGIGRATKKLHKILKLPKTYEAEVTLGATSSTDDAEGVLEGVGGGVLGVGDIPTRDAVENALQKFTGTIEQVPPQFSAVKVHGVAAYRRARKGESTELPARPVTIYAVELLSYAYPIARIRWSVSSGTYIRSLARDIGQHLGTGAYLSALRRTSIGSCSVDSAYPLAQLSLADVLPLRHF